MRGMELWRPDWAKINGTYNRPDAEELVQVTRETARLALGCLQDQNAKDYYGNYGAAERELTHILAAPLIADQGTTAAGQAASSTEE